MKKFLTWLWGVEESLTLKQEKEGLKLEVHSLEWDIEHILKVMQDIVLDPSTNNIESGKELLRLYDFGDFSK